MSTVLTPADQRKLIGLNRHLVALVHRVALVYPGQFIVVEGLRTKARQRQLVAEKKSRTLNSQHIVGRAVDIAPIVNGKVSWRWSDFTELIECAKTCASDMSLPMTFGYDWGWDAPHWEMKHG